SSLKFVNQALSRSRSSLVSCAPGRSLSILKIMSSYYKNVAKRVFVPEKMNILRSAIYATGID
ncbi:hypothetical protein, partial [Citrobacter freundii]|uniref:hypothetical protein n=1 Tax=Citrobacter freundii TaxID=546 RepID=UPI002F966551